MLFVVLNKSFFEFLHLFRVLTADFLSLWMKDIDWWWAKERFEVNVTVTTSMITVSVFAKGHGPHFLKVW